MTVDEVTTVFAVLATAGALAVVGLLAALLVPATRPAVRTALAGQGWALAWLVAAAATLGSVYLSEVANFPPCRLCWAQRAAMYPLVVLLALGGLGRVGAARVVGLVLAGVGLVVNLWHVAVEIRPSLEGAACDPTNPCSIRWVEQLGFWTIPRMATVAFALVIITLANDLATHRSTATFAHGPSTRTLEDSLS